MNLKLWYDRHVQTGKVKVWNEIRREELEGLKGFTWKKIAEILGVSERTLRTKGHKLEITDKYTWIRDNELDNFIQKILEESPNIGEKNASRRSAITWSPNSTEAFALLYWKGWPHWKSLTTLTRVKKTVSSWRTKCFMVSIFSS